MKPVDPQEALRQAREFHGQVADHIDRALRVRYVTHLVIGCVALALAVGSGVAAAVVSSPDAMLATGIVSLVLLVAGGSLLALGRLYAPPSARLLREGHLVRAKVLELKAGLSIRLPRGGTATRVVMRLQLEGLRSGPVVVRHAVFLRPDLIMQAGPGEELDARVDPARPSRVVLVLPEGGGMEWELAPPT